MHIEMFALKVDLCDKCDPSQTKGLVRYNFGHAIENESVSVSGRNSRAADEWETLPTQKQSFWGV